MLKSIKDNSTVLPKIKTAAEVTVLAYTTTVAVIGIVNLAKDAVEKIRENRESKKNPTT